MNKLAVALTLLLSTLTPACHSGTGPTTAQVTADALCVLQETATTLAIKNNASLTTEQKAEALIIEVAPQLATCIMAANASAPTAAPATTPTVAK